MTRFRKMILAGIEHDVLDLPGLAGAERLARLPYFNQARNAACLVFALLSYNLRRLDRIIAL